jgi:type IV pilus assembly protein PilO
VSTAIVTPPPQKRTSKEQMEWMRDQAVGWLSPLNLHLLGAAILLVLNVYLIAHVMFLWSKGGSSGEEALSQAQAQKLAADLASRPLRGLDSKLAISADEANKFYEVRLPYAYSNLATELGEVAKRTNVKLSRVQYQQQAPSNGVTEVRMDAALTGDYVSLAHFINGLERNKSFFLITAIGLSGQQSGIVNLRLRITSYLREPMPLVPETAAGGAQQ